MIVVLASVPMALLRRRMSFRLLAIQGTIATFAAQVVAIAMALEGAGPGRSSHNCLSPR